MSYFQVLGLTREPFSTSPDPSFFFLSREHRAAFCRLQIAISLKRGMSVVLGDVGTGKTTLSRKLARILSTDDKVDFHLILNPFFRTEKQFLSRLAGLMHVEVSPRASALDHLEAIERDLFKKGVEEKRTIVLLVDEAQMLPDFVLELLRTLLNYETNEEKILQLVLVGQMELLPRISRIHNFWDRIALKYVLNPLGEEEVREMIEYRMRQAGYQGSDSAPMFTKEAVRAIWQHTQGYPRKLTMLCHNCLESLVMQDARMVDERIVRQVIAEEVRPILPDPEAAPSRLRPLPDMQVVSVGQ
jgi:general secretion pathway protein A